MIPATGNVTPVTVLHIASGDLWAGAEVQLFTLVRALHYSPGVSARVILLNHGALEEKLHKEGVDVLVLEETSLSSLQILLRIKRSISEQPPDIIHTHRLKENILGSIAGYLAGGVPSMRTVHGAPEHKPSWRQIPKLIIRSLDRLTGKHFQRRIIAVSEELAVFLRHTFPAEKVRVIENGIDLDSLYTQENHSTSAADTKPGTLRIGLAGRLVPVKRVDLFIKTARYIQDNYPDLDAGFHIFGDGPLRSELETLSREQSTDGIIHFEGHCEDMADKLRNLDILVMTSEHEGLPMILLEAMTLKVAVIAHAVGGIPVLLDNGACGALVRNHAPEGYAHEIRRLSQSRKTRTELSDKALKRVKSCYSAEENAHQYLAEYKEIIKTA